MRHARTLHGTATASLCACAVAMAGCSSGAAGGREASFQRQRAVSAVLSLPASSAESYRALLPATFDAPQELQVLVTVVSYDEVTAPLVPYREGYVMLACAYEGRLGWYTLTMPVTDPVANDLGRSIGYPKYVADRIDLDADAAGVWTGEVVHQRRSVLRLELTPSAPPATVTLTDGAPSFTLAPPGEGPTIYEVAIRGSRTARTTAGTAAVTSQAEEPWAELLSQSTLVSAQYAETSGDWYLDPTQRR
jgi:hypothetical protein